tara:strand:- start:40 stop:1065 length:1026 start_codon:yes stop_codon:yes gene_type:complete
MQYSIFSVFGLLKFCFRFRFILLLSGVLAIIVSSVVALFFITPKFKSVAVISPTTTSSISQALLIEDNPYKKDIFEFGEDESIEQLMQVITSDLVRDLVIDEFDLYNYYEINPDDPLSRTWVNLEYQENFIFKKTNLGSIKITVFDEDPKKASEMANSFIGSEGLGIIDIAYNQIRADRAEDNITICEYRKEVLDQKLKEVNDSLNNLRKKYGIVYPERQIERLTEQKAIALRNNIQAGANKIQEELDVFNQHVTQHDYYKVQSLEIQEELHRIEDVVELAFIELNYPFQNFFIIDRAFPAEKKSKPIRWLIVFGSVLSTLFFTIIIIQLFSVINKIKNED